MTVSLIDEYIASWSPGSKKIELMDGKLIVGDRLAHSRLLLSQIMRGWGMEAVIALAPEWLWWQALTHSFDAPMITSEDALDALAMQGWAGSVTFDPDIPKHGGEWRWTYSQLRQTLYMGLFGLDMRSHQLGSTLGGGFVNKLDSDAVMPDVLFWRGEPRNRLYEYYLDGPAELIVEFMQPGCEEYVRYCKRSRYQAAGVPEFWIIDPENQEIELLRLVEGSYQRQTPDAAGGYAISSIPGLTFFCDRLWLIEERRRQMPSEILFQVAADAPKVDKIPTIGDGVDWSKGLLKFPVALEPVTISFDDYIYWCPEAKFEFVDGRPDIGGRDGIKGLTGMLLMTFGLAEVVKLGHPQDWVSALLKIRAKAKDPSHKDYWWNIARQTATFLREHYDIDRIAVAGDLVTEEALNFWSELVLVLWGVSSQDPRYISPRDLVEQLPEQPPIRLIDASRSLTTAEAQSIPNGAIDL